MNEEGKAYKRKTVPRTRSTAVTPRTGSWMKSQEKLREGQAWNKSPNTLIEWVRKILYLTLKTLRMKESVRARYGGFTKTQKVSRVSGITNPQARSGLQLLKPMLRWFFLLLTLRYCLRKRPQTRWERAKWLVEFIMVGITDGSNRERSLDRHD